MNEANRGYSIKSEGKRLVSRRYIHSGSLALVPELRSSCEFLSPGQNACQNCEHGGDGAPTGVVLRHTLGGRMARVPAEERS